jgi:hypothetical protein
MRKLFSMPALWIAAAVVSLPPHLLWAWRTHDGTQAARCGALWVVFAGALIARPIIRAGYKEWYESTKIINGGHFPPTAEDIEEDKQGAIDAKCVQVFAPALAVGGTILWAYGDWFVNLFVKCH